MVPLPFTSSLNPSRILHGLVISQADLTHVQFNFEYISVIDAEWTGELMPIFLHRYSVPMEMSCGKR